MKTSLWEIKDLSVILKLPKFNMKTESFKKNYNTKGIIEVI